MLWGGRFKEKLDDEALEFSSSLKFDSNLLEEDIKVSIAHVEMLEIAGLISKFEKGQIINGLEKITDEWKNNQWFPDSSIYEDVHSAIEGRLVDLIGDVAKKLHTGRSRNDQVSTAFRLWIKKAINKLITANVNLQKSLLKVAIENTDTIMPGYTHLQRAQPVSLAYHFLAYVEMLERDKQRLKFVYSESDVSPLGSGALAGSTLPIDRKYTAKRLGFSKLSFNSLDAVSDRDFAIDFLNACNLGMMHLSRLSEELIVWSSFEWDFIKLHDKFATGSSLMPQKKNPDIPELVRGKNGRVFGNYISLLTVMKGLPLSYNRDMQEDKEPVFDSFTQYFKSLNILSKLIISIKINRNKFKSGLDGDFILATDLAEWLVKKGIPFREAHKIVGTVVLFAEEKKIKLTEIDYKELIKIHPVFNDKEWLNVLEIKNSLKAKKTIGSPNPDMIKNEIERWKGLLKLH